jgi:hypothetical protein
MSFVSYQINSTNALCGGATLLETFLEDNINTVHSFTRSLTLGEVRFSRPRTVFEISYLTKEGIF